MMGTYIGQRVIKSVYFVLLCLTTVSLVGCADIPTIWIPPPKVYDEGQARKALSQRSRDLNALVKGIQAGTIQEVSGTSEATRYGFIGSFSPPGLSSAPSPTKTDSGLVSSGPIQKADPTIGLTYSDLLRQRVSQDQMIMNYELMYEGDQKFLSPDKRLVILRYDISILDFVEKRSLAVIRFDLTRERPVLTKEDPKERNRCDSTKEEPQEREVQCNKDSDLIVYTIGPEYTSRVSQESLLTSIIRSYEAQGGAAAQAGSIQLAGQYSNSLQEAFLSIAEQPTQFGIYTECPNRFMVAFGPRRSIEKRSWINPARIFGNTYDIKYTLEPGLRSMYVALIIPAEVHEFWIRAVFPEKYIRYDNTEKILKLYADLQQSYNPFYQYTVKWWLDPVLKIVSSVKPPSPPPSKINLKDLKHSEDFSCEDPLIHPSHLYPAITNTFSICSPEPVSSGTQVMIGPLAVPKSNVLVLNKNHLLVTVNQDLNLALYNNAMAGKEENSEEFDVMLLAPDAPRLKTIGRVHLQFTKNPIALGGPAQDANKSSASAKKAAEDAKKAAEDANKASASAKKAAEDANKAATSIKP
jgi:hypothetical protein